MNESVRLAHMYLSNILPQPTCKNDQNGVITSPFGAKRLFTYRVGKITTQIAREARSREARRREARRREAPKKFGGISKSLPKNSRLYQSSTFVL